MRWRWARCEWAAAIWWWAANDGADLWRVDEVSQDPEAADLHDGDAELIVTGPAVDRFVTIGDDGRAHLWSTRSGQALGAPPIPSGRPFAAAWSAGNTAWFALTSSTLALVTEMVPGTQSRWHSEMESPGRIALLDHDEAVLLAVTDRHRVRLIAPGSGDAGVLEVPEEALNGRRLSQAARNVVSVAWASAAGEYLVVGAQGGVLARWSRHDGASPGRLVPIADGWGIVTVIVSVPRGSGSRILAGGHLGALGIYDASSGAEVFDLATDDARVVGRLR